MIDPTDITHFNRTDAELEEFLLFCIAVAGKNARTTSRNLERLLESGKGKTPFEKIRNIASQNSFAETLKSFGFGCYNLKAKGLLTAAESDFDLNKCSVQELEKIPGVGHKTSRFFILHSRKNANVACLDTHILKWLSKHTGDSNVPKVSPGSKKIYLKWENIFLEIAKSMNIPPAKLDLDIWNELSGSFS